MMGRIFYIMGKSASGKDSVYSRLLELLPEMGTYTMYTTRPAREGEQPGKSYHFVDEAVIRRFEKEGKLIESRTYDTVFGPWTYATADDGQIDLDLRDYIIAGTLESYVKMCDYYGRDSVIPVYIEVEDGERLIRAVRREMKESCPKYAEVCRRFLSDSEDFSEEKLAGAGISRRYINNELEKCVKSIAEDITDLLLRNGK